MKKYLLILVVMICFGLSANAQAKAFVSGEPEVHINQYNKTVTIRVPVTVDFGTASGLNCRAVVKICPKSRTPLDALHINCEWSGVIPRDGKNKFGKGSVTFSCSVKDSSVFQRCGAYDFDVSSVSLTYCN